MDKRISKRHTGKLIAAAAAATAGLVSWGTPQQANASLVLDLRATAVTAGQGAVISADKKSVTVTPGNTVTVTMALIARITGANSVQQTGEFGGGGGDDVRNDDSLGIITGSILSSTGGLLGNMTTGAAGQVTPKPNTAPFVALGSTNGVASDWDSDGDLDLGVGGTGTDASVMYSGRSASAAHATLWGPSASVPGAKAFSVDDGSASGINANDVIVSPSIQELQVGLFRFVTSGNGTSTSLNFFPRPVNDTGSALWFEDGVTTGKSPATGTFAAGAPLVVVAPEPGSLGLLGIASLGLLARRKKNA